MQEQYVSSPKQSEQKTQPEKTYPPITQKELSSYKSLEEWLNFFKRYDLISEDMTVKKLQENPVTVKLAEINRRVGKPFDNFVRSNLKENRNKIASYIPGILIEVKPLPHWKTISELKFYQELIGSGINMHDPPLKTNLPGNIKNALRLYPRLKEMYDKLLKQAEKQSQSQLPPNSSKDLDLLTIELQKQDININDLVEQKITISSLGSKWEGRVKSYGGRAKFLTDLSKKMDKEIDIKTRKKYSNFGLEQWKEEFASIGLSTDSLAWIQLGKHKNGNRIKRHIMKIGGVEAFFQRTGIRIIKFENTPPPGWITANSFLSQLKDEKGIVFDWRTLKKIVQNFKQVHQDQFAPFTARGFLREHFSPEIAEKIKQAVLEGNRGRNHKQESIDSAEANKWLQGLIQED